ncbi:GyrI-like domain-containing protein [Streptosporangium sp. CA-135522]|uniref:GyrI-like domain-containing protein n=1 Tax=Streptosporangium sp. CA-135522 TaxID=3240072 RepID=UPI003D8B3537
MTPQLIDHGPVTCLNVTGRGAPGGPEHVSAIQALYTVAAVMNVQAGPLEGRWWVEDERPYLEVSRDEWRWHLLLPLPDLPEPGTADAARETARVSGAAVDRVQVVTFTEGRCVELIHEGPYSEEHVSLKVMDDFMTEHGLVHNGLHHEVYLSAFDDPAPRTLLRQPVASSAGQELSGSR